MNKLWVWAGVGALLAQLGCSKGEEEPHAWLPLDECPQLDLSTCDARNAKCQQRLLQIAGCLYGVKQTPRVPVRVVTERQLREEGEADAEDATEDEADLAHIERALVDLKLMRAGDLTQPSDSNDIITRLAGFYRDPEHGITLIDRGMPQNTSEANGLLVHELTHAIQDAEIGLDAWRMQYPGDFDALLGLRTVTEGQATFVQLRALFAMNGYPATPLALERALDRFRSQLLAAAHDDPSPYFAAITTFPYAYGAELAYQAWRSDGAEFARAQYEAPPQSSWEVLRRWEEHDSPGFLKRDGSAAPPEPIAPKWEDDGYRAVDDTTLGAFLLDLSLGKFESGVGGWGASLGWVYDRLWVGAGPDNQTAWLWQVSFDDDASASALENALTFDAGLDVNRQGRRVTCLGGTYPGASANAGSAFLNASP